MANDIVSAADDTLDNALDGAASVALGVYLIMVVYRGNVIPLLSEVKKEYGYLEFLVALFILYRLMKIESIRPLVAMFVTGALVVAALNMSKVINLPLLKDYGDGKISLFKVVSSTFGAK